MSKKKEKMLSVLNDVQKDALELQKAGRRVVENASFSWDVAECAKEFVTGLSSEDSIPAQEWDRTIHAWQDWQRGASFMEDFKSSVNTFSAVVAASTTTTNTFIKIVRIPSQKQFPVDLTKPIKRFYELLDKNALASEVKSSMIRLGLNCYVCFSTKS